MNRVYSKNFAGSDALTEACSLRILLDFFKPPPHTYLMALGYFTGLAVPGNRGGELRRGIDVHGPLSSISVAQGYS